MSTTVTTTNSIIDFSPTAHPHSQTRKRSRREGAKWTRSGCLTCKRRRKRCDEAKPTCRACNRLGLSCEGYGSMWAEPLNPSAQVFQQATASKRRRTGFSPALEYSPVSSEELSPRSIPSSYLSPSPSPSSFEYGTIQIRSPSADSTDAANFNEPLFEPKKADELTVVIPSPSGCISHLSTIETHYLQYHMEHGSKLLANLENDENPLRSLLIPRALSSPLLMKALCALSAMHFANRSQDSLCAQTTAADYYVQTLSGLRSGLAGNPGGALPDESIIAVGLLIKYEIVRGSVQQWSVHLDALEKLLISRGGFAAFDRDTAEFLWGLLVYAQNIAKITNRSRANNRIPGSENMTLRKLDIYIGYTEEIIKICARIADLSSLSHDLVAFGIEIHAIDAALHDWTHENTRCIIPKGISADTLFRLRVVAECFRDAAYIYLHSTLERLGHNDLILSSVWSSFVSVTKSEAVHRCLRRIESLPLDEHCEYSALTFPLFMSGCETDHDADHEFILASLRKLEVNFGIGNVKRAKELLRLLWDGEKRHWMDVLEDLGWNLIVA
ncbi:fungal-specific transcription factor domain-containing protein [Aspergillus ambiguus]|uniref:Zn(II)2Cys6 transcription factor n=1 Tax=Aspergillus ambiguus TaxID=176160 RepID=UPI003CCCD156